MLALRLQRTGRKKLAQYRLIAQEHSLTPTSGKVAAYLGNYNPHDKTANFDKEKIEYYLGNGAQPSNRVAKLLEKEGVKLPDWVTIKTKEPKKEEVADEATETKEEQTPEAESAEESEEAKTEDASAEKAEEDSPAEETAEESDK